MSRLHRIVGVPVGASKADIKKAYRAKAKKLHPDRNPSPNAADQFAELQLAYDTLMLGSSTSTSRTSSSSRPSKGSSTTNQRKTYTKTQSSTRPGSTSSSKTKKTTSKKTYQSERERRRAEKIREDRSNERYFQRLVNSKRGKFVHFGSILCAIIAVCYLLEPILPKHKISDQINVVGNAIGEGRWIARDQTIYTKGGEEFSVEYVDVSWARTDTNIIIEKTWFFHFPTSVKQKRKYENQNYGFTYNFYLDYWQKLPMPLIFFGFPAILLFYRKRTINFTVVYMVSFYLVIPLSIIFLLLDFRWLHLLTLGFF